MDHLDAIEKASNSAEVIVFSFFAVLRPATREKRRPEGKHGRARAINV